MEISVRKKKVPYQWYREISVELGRAVLNVRPHIRQLQERIDKVIESGLGYEVHTIGQTVRHIPLEVLQEWLAQAPTYEVQSKRFKEFKAKHIPVKGLQGNLMAAKWEIRYLVSVGKVRQDFRYTWLHKLADKYYLSNKQIDSLMNEFSKLNLI
jgi:hypothetical protein